MIAPRSNVKGIQLPAVRVERPLFRMRIPGRAEKRPVVRWLIRREESAAALDSSGGRIDCPSGERLYVTRRVVRAHGLGAGRCASQSPSRPHGRRRWRGRASFSLPLSKEGDVASKIEDYGLIGNTLTAALVSRSGSIDWLCAPRFDSDACFTALIGYDEHGRWGSGRRCASETRQRYRDDTLVLETEFVVRRRRGPRRRLHADGRALRPGPDHRRSRRRGAVRDVAGHPLRLRRRHAPHREDGRRYAASWRGRTLSSCAVPGPCSSRATAYRPT